MWYWLCAIAVAIVLGGVFTQLAANEEDPKKRKNYAIIYWVLAALSGTGITFGVWKYTKSQDNKYNDLLLHAKHQDKRYDDLKTLHDRTQHANSSYIHTDEHFDTLMDVRQKYKQLLQAKSSDGRQAALDSLKKRYRELMNVKNDADLVQYYKKNHNSGASGSGRQQKRAANFDNFFNILKNHTTDNDLNLFAEQAIGLIDEGVLRKETILDYLKVLSRGVKGQPELLVRISVISQIIRNGTRFKLEPGWTLQMKLDELVKEQLRPVVYTNTDHDLDAAVEAYVRTL